MLEPCLNWCACISALGFGLGHLWSRFLDFCLAVGQFYTCYEAVSNLHIFISVFFLASPLSVHHVMQEQKSHASTC